METTESPHPPRSLLVSRTSKSELPFNRENDLRHSTGSIKGKTANATDTTDGPSSVHNLIKGFQSKITNGSSKRNSIGSTEGFSYQSDNNTGHMFDSPAPENVKARPTTKRKLSLRYKKGKISSEDARHILQCLGMSPNISNENRSVEKSFAFFDIQSLFFALGNAAQLKLLYEDGSSYTKKLTGASAASVRTTTGRSKVNAGEFDPSAGRFRSRAESMIDEGDNKENLLLQNCPYFRNEIAEPEESNAASGEATTGHARDITQLISMFNRNRSFENLRNNLYDQTYSKQRDFHPSEQDILLEEVNKDSSFLTWDIPNVSGKRIFDFEHIDRGAMYYREYFSDKEHTNLFGIDEKFGPMAVSVIREHLTKTAVWGHNTNDEKNKKYQYRIIFRTCELYALRISVLETSIPSTSRHGGNRGLPIKDVLEYCFPEVQLTCLRHCLPGPKVPEQLIKLDEQQLTLKYKIGLIYCKAGQKTEEEMYNNENGGSEFSEFCSVIADKVALKGFQGYRAQLDNKNDSTGAHSLYTTFHGREVMFHVSTELPFTSNDRQQLLRKRHIGNDIVTVIFQEPGCVPFTPQMMRSHFQHVFIVVRVENQHTENTKYEVAVTRSKDVPYFGPPVPPTKFLKNAAFREFLLSKLINAENAAHKSEKFTHMARRTRYEYLKDLAMNQVSAQTIEPSNKFAFPSFSSKKKEKTRPDVNPEIWLQSGLVWYVKFDDGLDSSNSLAYLSISTKSIIFVDESAQEILLSIPCKQVLGWRPTSHTLKLFYDTGKMAFFTMCENDLNELPHVINRLKAVTPGCETQDLALRRNNDGQLGFHVFYEGLVAEVEPYGLAWQSGLRKGSRLLEVSGHVVGGMSHERMILMLKRPGAVRIVVLPPAPDGQPRNYKAVRNLRRYSSMTSVYSMSATALGGIGDRSSLYSSKENLTGSHSGSSPVHETTNILEREGPASEGISQRRGSDNSTTSASAFSDSSSYDVPQCDKPPAYSVATQQQQQLSNGQQFSAERLVTSRSATDIPTQQSRKCTANLKPSESVEIELGEIERQLTDTRKSIDAKFYRSLANSPSSFFQNRRSPVETVHEPPELLQNSSELQKKETGRDSDMQRPVAAYLSSNGNENIIRRAERPSMEQAFEDAKVPPSPSINLDHNSTHCSGSRYILQKSEPVDIEIDPRRGQMKIKPGQLSRDKYSVKEDNLSDCSTLVPGKSQESLSEKENDSATKVNIVRTKVRDANEIISERRSKDSPSSSRKFNIMQKSNSIDLSPKLGEKTFNKDFHRHSLGSRKPPLQSEETNQASYSASPIADRRIVPINSPKSPNSPRLNHKDVALIRAVEMAAKNKAAGKKTENSQFFTDQKSSSPENNKLDDSLTTTFAKLDAAFSFKTSSDAPTREEKRKKKKRNDRRRSKNFEPPSSDSSEDMNLDSKRRGRTTTTTTTYSVPEEQLSSRLPRSEAEESLEAAISEFHLELSSMPEKSRSCSISSQPLPNENSSPILTPKEEGCSPFQKLDDQASRLNEDHPPKVPVRTSRPKILIDHQINKQKQKTEFNSATVQISSIKDGRKYSEPVISTSQRNSRVRSEVMTSLRPWSPPFVHPQNTASIKEHAKLSSGHKVAQKVAVFDPVKREEVKVTIHDVKGCQFEVGPKTVKKLQVNLVATGDSTKMTTGNETKKLSNLPLKTNISVEKTVEEPEVFSEQTTAEDQLSPLPRALMSPCRGGVHSLPNRSKKRRVTLTGYELHKAKSATCIPLAVRGLDLATSRETSSVPWSKDDLAVMLTVMENELEQEREEKERLSQELNRSREEKERLLEQSKQAASQLRKFTSLFLDASPQELEKAKQRYSDKR